MNVLKLILGLLLASVLVVFGAQNTQSVSFHFLGWDTPSAPVVLALAIAVLLGVILTWMVSVPGRFRGRRERRALKHQVKVQDRTPEPSVDAAESPSEGEERTS
ncbi:MAG: LapA family protein [Dehalococcoidia bacterium]